MKTYKVSIARTETTVYDIEVEAKDETQAERLAYNKFNVGDYDDEKIVFGEENTHNIEEV